MDKLKINLIPPEIKEKAKKEAKKSLLVRVSIGLLGILILFTSGVLAMIIYQNSQVQALTAQLDQEKSKIGSLKDKEGAVFFLKNRLVSINAFSDEHYKQGETYDLITSLFPPEVNLSSLQIDQTEKIVISGDTNNTASLDTLFNNLTDPKVNEGKIASSTVESLSKSQSGGISFNLTVTMKEKLSQ